MTIKLNTPASLITTDTFLLFHLIGERVDGPTPINIGMDEG